MTVTSGTIIAFSAAVDRPHVAGPGNDESTGNPQDLSGTPMLVQVSMVTTVARPMSSEEFKKVMEFIKKSKDAIKDTYKSAKDFYKENEKTIDRLKAGGEALMGIGDILGGIKKWSPDEADPMAEKLAELETEVKQLGEKLSDNFGEMKAFISEQSFFTNIMSPTSVLSKHMRDCLKKPSENNKANFEREYKKNMPLKLQYNLQNYLQQKTTNVLRLSMDAERVKTKATFDKWEDIICRVMMQFLFLEAFAGGLFGSKDMTNVDHLIDSSIEVMVETATLREKYKEDEEYWKELKANFEKYITDNTKLSKMQKAEEIKKRLDKYLTSDTFYICVFNEASWGNQYNYNFSPQLIAEQLIMNVNKGGCCAFVYRSRTAWKMSKDDYVKLKDQVSNASSKIGWGGLFSKIYDDYYRSMAGGYELYFLMIPSCDAAVCYSDADPVIKWDGFNYSGPGAYTKLPLSAPQYYSIVAFK